MASNEDSSEAEDPPATSQNLAVAAPEIARWENLPHVGAASP